MPDSDSDDEKLTEVEKRRRACEPIDPYADGPPPTGPMDARINGTPFSELMNQVGRRQAVERTRAGQVERGNE
jgi:hypothetical protein